MGNRTAWAKVPKSDIGIYYEFVITFFPPMIYKTQCKIGMYGT